MPEGTWIGSTSLGGPQGRIYQNEVNIGIYRREGNRKIAKIIINRSSKKQINQSIISLYQHSNQTKQSNCPSKDRQPSESQPSLSSVDWLGAHTILYDYII